MKFSVMLLFFSMTVIQSIAQNLWSYSARGVVVDSSDNSPISYAVVRLVYHLGEKRNASLALTDATGGWTFSIPQRIAIDSFIVEANGFKRFIWLGQQGGIPEKISLSINSRLLEGVVVSESRIKRDIDKISFSVREKDFLASATAVDILRQVPLLAVDGNGNVLIQGQFGAQIFLDGKQISKDQLRSLTRDMIKSVEVINNPSARYGGDFNAIVNIISRRPASNLFKGNLALMQGAFRSYSGASGSIIMKSGKWYVNALVGGLINTQNSEMRVIRERAGRPVLSQTGNADFTPLSANGHFQAFYDIDSTRSLNLALSTSLIDEERSQSTENESFEPFRQTFARSVRSRRILNRQGELEFRKNYRDKSFFVLAIRFYTKVTRRSFDLSGIGKEFEFGQRGQDTAWHREKVLSFIYSRPLFTKLKGRFETGLSFVGRQSNGYYSGFKLDTASRIYVTDLTNFGQIDFQQLIGVQYSNLRFTVKKLVVSTGLRTEWEHSRILVNESSGPSYRTHFNVLPNISLFRDYGKSGSIRGFFSYRIRRPSINYLNPYVYSEDPGQQFTGNPFLRPEKLFKSELSYSAETKRKLFINFSIFNHQSSEILMEITLNSPNGVLNRSFANVGRENIMGANLSSTATLFKNLNVNTSIFGQFYSIEGTGMSNSGWIWGASFNGSIMLRNGLAISAYLTHTNRNIELQSKTRLNPFTDLSISKAILRNKLNIGLRWQDITGNAITMRSSYYDGVYRQSGFVRNRLNNLILRVQFNFGGNVSAKKRVGINIDDLKSDPK